MAKTKIVKDEEDVVNKTPRLRTEAKDGEILVCMNEESTIVDEFNKITHHYLGKTFAVVPTETIKNKIKEGVLSKVQSIFDVPDETSGSGKEDEDDD